MKRAWKSVLVCGLVGVPAAVVTAHAMKLSPEGTKIEYMEAKRFNRSALDAFMRAAAFDLFTSPVHEELTQRMFGCEADIADARACGDLQLEYAGIFPIIGVRWNDDPPFRLETRAADRIGCDSRHTIRFATQPRCWVKMFRIAQKRAGRGRTFGPNNANLLFRSHFGDLQFLHSMAAADGEAAAITRSRVLAWSGFTWKIATGEIGLQQPLRDLREPDLREFFGQSGWTVQDLFTLGIPALRAHLREVALGSLLHALQDSFAAGHVERADPVAGAKCRDAPGFHAPGRIREFHAYGWQDHRRHAAADSREAVEAHVRRYRDVYGVAAADGDAPHVVNIGRNLVTLLAEKQLKWTEARPYLECVFDLDDTARPSSPGADFTPR